MDPATEDRVTKRQLFRCLLLFLLVDIFLLLNALWLQTIENNHRHEYNRHVKSSLDKVMDFLNNTSFQFSQSRNVTPADLEEFYTRFAQMEKDSRKLYIWEYSDAIYYWTEVITTIGYGDIVCHSDQCKLMTMLIGTVGIAFMIVLLRDMASIIRKTSLLLWNNIQSIYHFQNPCASTALNTLVLILFLSGFYTVFWFVPALLIAADTGWSLFTSHYFLYVTFSTIGFGDYTLREWSSNRGVFWIVFMFIGLAALASLITILTERLTKLSQTLQLSLANSTNYSSVNEAANTPDRDSLRH